jgi:hypothetical protein
LAAGAHIQLKFGMWIRHRNTQVKFEFGYGPMIFDRVIPLEKKNTQIWSQAGAFVAFTTHLVFSLLAPQTQYMAFPILATRGGIRVVTTHLVI